MAEHRSTEPTVRRRRPRTPVGIPYSTVQALIAHLHGIGGDDVPALASRLQNLRKTNFPDGVAAGSGRHFAYDAADVLGVAVAFELIEAFIPPAVAADVVRDNWPEIARAALLGWAADAARSTVFLYPRALGAGLGRGVSAAGLHHMETAWVDVASVSERTLQFDLGDLAQRIKVWLKRFDPRSHRLMDEGMAGLDRRFGGGPALERGSLPPRLGSDGPFWRRASALLVACRSGYKPADERRLRWYLDYCVRPAPVDAWKRRIEVAEGVETGFAAALAWICSTARLTPRRTTLETEALSSVGRQLLVSLGSSEEILTRLEQVVHAALASDPGNEAG